MVFIKFLNNFAAGKLGRLVHALSFKTTCNDKQKFQAILKLPELNSLPVTSVQHNIYIYTQKSYYRSAAAACNPHMKNTLEHTTCSHTADHFPAISIIHLYVYIYINI